MDAINAVARFGKLGKWRSSRKTRNMRNRRSCWGTGKVGNSKTIKSWEVGKTGKLGGKLGSCETVAQLRSEQTVSVQQLFFSPGSLENSKESSRKRRLTLPRWYPVVRLRQRANGPAYLRPQSRTIPPHEQYLHAWRMSSSRAQFRYGDAPQIRNELRYRVLPRTRELRNTQSFAQSWLQR